MSDTKRPWTPGPWLTKALTVYSLTDGPNPENIWWARLSTQHNNASHADLAANASLISVAPDMAEALLNFEIKGPDADGLVWLILHGRGTTGKGMLQIGHADTLIAQVAVSLEGDRLAALRKAGMEGV